VVGGGLLSPTQQQRSRCWSDRFGRQSKNTQNVVQMGAVNKEI
jgi:hypothetical protein